MAQLMCSWLCSPCGSTEGPGREADLQLYRARKAFPEQLYFKNIIDTIQRVYFLRQPLLGYFSEVYFHTGFFFSITFRLFWLWFWLAAL